LTHPLLVETKGDFLSPTKRKGKGIIPDRPLDQFGIGYYYLDVHNPTFSVRCVTKSFLRDEYGFEAYYNCAVTPWMRLTPHIQIVRPAQKDAVSVTTGGAHGIHRESIDTVTVLGVRFQLILRCLLWKDSPMMTSRRPMGPATGWGRLTGTYFQAVHGETYNVEFSRVE
jgi:hypothetical protein